MNDPIKPEPKKDELFETTEDGTIELNEADTERIVGGAVLKVKI